MSPGPSHKSRPEDEEGVPSFSELVLTPKGQEQLIAALEEREPTAALRELMSGEKELVVERPKTVSSF